jgi:hypothetical protein
MPLQRSLTANPLDLGSGIHSRAEISSAANQRARPKTTTSGFRTIAGSLLFFLLTFVAIRHVKPMGIILYQGVVLGLSVSLGQFVLERRRAPHVGDAAKNALLSFLLIYCFVFTIPTTVDRAYSVKMLTAVGRSPDGLTRREISDVFVDGLVAGGGIDKRLLEQTATGSLQAENGRYSLTRMGRLLNASFRITQVIFACEDPDERRAVAGR